MNDIVIVGGGLAGLSLAILCARKGMHVTLIEKSSYPKHKVCGEYISKESLGFLQSLGIATDNLQLPSIDTFVLTSHHGLKASCHLQPGGIGISRFLLDQLLADIAIQEGVHLLENTKVTNIDFLDQKYRIETQNQETIYASLCVGSYGRISGLQKASNTSSKDFIGVKYHVNEGPNKNVIEIHNFEAGYCGISAIENDKYCLCYLAKADALKKFKGNIDKFEEEILFKNTYLKDRFKAHKLIDRVTTSQLQFGLNADNLPYPVIGDAAGFIPPLTGNGMSLAFRSAKDIYLKIINQKANENLSQINKEYTQNYLSGRIQKGILLQNLLFIQNPYFNKALMYGLMKIPGLLQIMSTQAVGKEI
jgi:flavin-dependent dehydrogenase